MLSLVIPCYNEDGNIERFFSETNRVFAGKIDKYEFVFVNDGSTDKTHQVLKKLFNDNKNYNIQVLTFSRNFGKEAAMYAGLSKAKGDMVCIIDADLQQRPEVVVEMLDVLNSNPELDCVTAYQDERKEGAVISKMKSGFYKTISRLSDINFVNGASDFRLMKRNMVDAILSMTEFHRFSKGIFGYVGFNTEYIPYTAEKRNSGETKWNFRKLFRYGLDGIFAFSTKPLTISTYAGLFSAFCSVIYLIIVVIQKLAFGIDVPGYATIVVLLLLLGGLQLSSLGILGEYIAKMYVQVKDRPVYILKEHLSNTSIENDLLLEFPLSEDYSEAFSQDKTEK